MTTQVTDTDFVQRQLRHAQVATDAARASVAEAEPGYDYRWNLTALVRSETEMLLYRRVLDDGLESAAKVAVSLLTSPLGSASTDAFANEIARQKAGAALEVLKFLTAVGLSYERLGELLTRGR